MFLENNHVVQENKELINELTIIEKEKTLEQVRCAHFENDIHDLTMEYQEILRLQE